MNKAFALRIGFTLNESRFGICGLVAPDRGEGADLLIEAIQANGWRYGIARTAGTISGQRYASVVFRLGDDGQQSAETFGHTDNHLPTLEHQCSVLRPS